METLYKRLVEWKNIENAYRILIESAKDKLDVLRRSFSPVMMKTDDDPPYRTSPDVLASLCKVIIAFCLLLVTKITV